ncbi:MAG: HAMP domain-containing sensor histidine kinase [Pseudomonadota bacterium]
MSFGQTNRLFRSSVFRWTMGSALALLLAMVVIWGVVIWISYKQTESSLLYVIEDERDRLIGILENDGPEEFGLELVYDEQEEWELENVYHAAEEEEFIYRLSTETGDFLQGFEDLEVDPDFRSREVFDPELPQRFSVLSSNLPNGQILSVGLFDPHELVDAKEIYLETIIRFGVIYIPLVLVLSFLLSQAIFRRLDRIQSAMDGISDKDPRKRIDTVGNNDEFDRLGSSINSMLDRLGHMRRQMDDASIGIAHDLKTPISKLNNRLELMEQDLGDPTALRKHIHTGKAQIENVLDVFDSLLRLGEVESGSRVRHFEELDLSELVGDVAESYQPVFLDHGKALEISLVSDLKITGDAGLLVQMVSNLLENGITHSGAQSNCWVRLQSSSSGVVLQIGDDGPGIPEEEMERIFERFYRLDRSRTKPGNGLGLSLVKSICDLHGANMTVLPNQAGTVIDIEFPHRIVSKSDQMPSAS